MVTVRTIKQPHIAKKISEALRTIPVGVNVESLLPGISLKWVSIRANTKGTSAFKESLKDMEFWADGYVTGSGRECQIVTGSYEDAETVQQWQGMTAGSPAPAVLVTRQLVCVVYDAHVFVQSLKDICAVAQVQMS